MAFDGVSYGDAPIIYPVDYHPEAPLTDRVISAVLQCGYYRARHGGRVLLQQSYGFNALNPALYQSPGIFSTVGAYRDLSRGNGWLGEEIKKLRAAIVFGAYSAAEGTVFHRIVVNGVPHSETDGEYLGEPIETALRASSAPDTQRWQPETVIAAEAVYTAQAEFSFPPIPRGRRLGFRVQAQRSANFTYKPFWVCLWHEGDTA